MVMETKKRKIKKKYETKKYQARYAQWCQDLITKPWCPLFGHLLLSDDRSLYEGDCIDMVEDARTYWGIPPGLYRKSSYPEPNEVLNWIDEKYLLIARRVYPYASEIYVNAYRRWMLVPSEYLIQQEFHIFSRSSRGGDDIDSKAIYALISIGFAMSALKAIIYNKKPKENTDVIEDMRIAEALLSEAEKLRLKFYAEKGKALLTGSQSGTVAKQQKARDNRDLWLKTAKELGENFKKIGVPLLTDRVCDKLNISKEKSYQSVYKYLLEIFPERKQKKSKQLSSF
jgi:hypothetical protein